MKGILTAEKEYTEKRISFYVKNPEYIPRLLESVDRLNEELEREHSDIRLRAKGFDSTSNLNHEIPWQAVIGELSEDYENLVKTHHSYLGYACAFTSKPLTKRELKRLREGGISDVYFLNETGYDGIIRGVSDRLTQGQHLRFFSKLGLYLQPRH